LKYGDFGFLPIINLKNCIEKLLNIQLMQTNELPGHSLDHCNSEYELLVRVDRNGEEFMVTEFTDILGFIY